MASPERQQNDNWAFPACLNNHTTKGKAMKETLYQTLQASEWYTQEELYWLLDNIGNPEANIWDQLVYASFCHALLDSLVTVKVFTWLVEQIMAQNLLFYQMLTRSFTALLAALLIELDCEEDSPYTASLSQRQKSIYFSNHSTI